jgi:hypothetical protein
MNFTKTFGEIDLIVYRNEKQGGLGELIVRINSTISVLMFRGRDGNISEIFRGELDAILLKLYIFPKYPRYQDIKAIECSIIDEYKFSLSNEEESDLLDSCFSILKEFIDDINSNDIEKGEIDYAYWQDFNRLSYELEPYWVVPTMLGESEEAWELWYLQNRSQKEWKLIKCLFRGNFPIIKFLKEYFLPDDDPKAHWFTGCFFRTVYETGPHGHIEY